MLRFRDLPDNSTFIIATAGVIITGTKVKPFKVQGANGMITMNATITHNAHTYHACIGGSQKVTACRV